MLGQELQLIPKIWNVSLLPLQLTWSQQNQAGAGLQCILVWSMKKRFDRKLWWQQDWGEMIKTTQDSTIPNLPQGFQKHQLLKHNWYADYKSFLFID